MKKTIITLGLSTLLATVSNAAISLSGTSVTGLGATNAPSGSLVLLVVDTGSNGFLSSSFSGDLLATADPLLSAQSNISIGGSFGGDYIMSRAAVTTAGALPGAFTFDNTATYQGLSFALVWFNGLTSSSTAANAGTTYGIVRGTDWVLPAVNGGESFSFSATDNLGTGSFFRVTVSSGVATNDSFTTSTGPIFQIVPETSTSLLGAIGALALLRRRRN